MIRPNLVSARITKWIGSPTSLLTHTALFIGAGIILTLHWWSFEAVMLIWNTLVSLEAIYLSIFIQMSVNAHTETLSEIADDIDDIQEEVSDED